MEEGEDPIRKAASGRQGNNPAQLPGVSPEIADLITESSQRGVAYGFYNALVGLAALPSSIVAGILWQSVAPAAPFILGAIMATLAVFLFKFW